MTAVATPLVTIRDLHKDYQALRPLRVRELVLEAGDVVSLAGVDPAAAEMLVSLLTGVALPDAGEVRVFDRPTSEIADTDQWLTLLDRLGLVTGRAALIERYTVLQNLALPLTLAIDPLPGEWTPKVEELAREVGVPEALWRLPVGEADGETQTRARLGRALALDPSLLLAEHPTTPVPRDRAAAFGADLGRIARARGLAVLAITADDAFARALNGRRLTHQPATGECTAAGFWSKILGR
jgi:predicted ABC-type transport system involved in lysophospholipase L1 biosynthesis ATPase subunit